MEGWANNVKASIDQHDIRQKQDVGYKPVADPITVFWNGQSIRKVS